MLKAVAKEKNEKILEQILIRLATNYRMLSEDEYKNFMTNLTRDLKSVPGISFNRDKMEELRYMTNMGANKAK